MIVTSEADKKCSICRGNGSSCSGQIPNRFCRDAKHIICDRCFNTPFYYRNFFQETTQHQSICPVRVNPDFEICGSPIVDVARLGIPLYMDMFTRSWLFPCTFSSYGCPFTGNGQQVLAHIATDCEMRDLGSCNMLSKDGTTTCTEVFLGSPINKLRHMMGVHGVKYEWKAEHIVDVPLKNSPEMGESWKLDHCQLLDYQKDEFCIMFVYSNKDAVRIWLCELNPERMGVRTGAQFEMTIYKASKTLPRRFFGFASTVIPLIQPGLLTPEATFWEQCIEISKDDLTHVAELGADEILKFKVKIIFDVEEERATGETARTATEQDQGVDDGNQERV